MRRIILDMGSGNTCKNSIDYACKMIEAVAAIDSHKHEIIFKWQLFSNEPPNLPLDHLVFSRAYTYAKAAGYKTTSSVFDKRSIDFLLNFEIPFVKIACRPRLYWLIGEVPRKIPVYVSLGWPYEIEDIPSSSTIIPFLCWPKYPAKKDEYDNQKHIFDKFKAVSDHTIGLELYREYKPVYWEKHFILEDDPKNPDSAGHAIKPDLLKEIIG